MMYELALKANVHLLQKLSPTGLSWHLLTEKKPC